MVFMHHERRNWWTRRALPAAVKYKGGLARGYLTNSGIKLPEQQNRSKERNVQGA